jgi:hypothetical protein
MPPVPSSLPPVVAWLQRSAKIKLLLLPFADSSPPVLQVLRIPATYPLPDTNPFMFEHAALNNTMLTPNGIHSIQGGVKLCICHDCYSPLAMTPPRVPKFALKNNLYRGTLPTHLSDITWVEEQVCALYRSTALVTRLYGSDDPSQPHVFRGNTCAFAQNTLSTAKKLPRTPSDVNNMLSVVFTGPSEKIPESCLKKVFRVQKQKIFDFLDFLRHHNILYHDIELDLATLDLYPVDGYDCVCGARSIVSLVNKCTLRRLVYSTTLALNCVGLPGESGTWRLPPSP